MTQPLEIQPPEPTPGPDLAPLLRLLQRAKGFALAFLKCNVPAERERLVGVLSHSLEAKGRSGRLLHLTEPVVDLLGEITRIEPPLGAGDVLFVLGFERSIPAEVDFPPALVRINMAREHFRDLPCPIVLVLPDYALTQLARQAPDFWAWRSGVFEVEVGSEELTAILQTDVPVASRELQRLSSERVKGHLAVLQEVLSEYAARGDSDQERLDLLRQIAIDLRSLGQLEKARAYAEEAMAMAMRLGDPLAEANALGALAVSRGDLGQLEEALEPARQAVELFRSLMDEESLAKSLSNLGAILGSLQRSQEALRTLEEAVELRRRLASEHQARFLLDLASALRNLGLALVQLERPEEALAAMQESSAICYQLASEYPDQSQPDLADSLSKLGIILARLSRREEALAASQEAVEIYRRLAAKRPEPFTSSLAANLTNMGGTLAALGRQEEALEAAEEAVQMFRSLESSRPSVLSDLAASLSNLAIILSALGRTEEALHATEERDQIRRLKPISELGSGGTSRSAIIPP